MPNPTGSTTFRLDWCEPDISLQVVMLSEYCCQTFEMPRTATFQSVDFKAAVGVWFGIPQNRVRLTLDEAGETDLPLAASPERIGLQNGAMLWLSAAMTIYIQDQAHRAGFIQLHVRDSHTLADIVQQLRRFHIPCDPQPWALKFNGKVLDSQISNENLRHLHIVDGSCLELCRVVSMPFWPPQA
jgi:hypothetical protein